MRAAGRKSQIHFFVSDEELSAFTKAAEDRGLSLSAWFRLIGRDTIRRQILEDNPLRAVATED